jgi:two-component system nitrate/nitrite response regulator NarL
VQPQAQQSTAVFAFISQPIVAEGLARVLADCPGFDYQGFCADPAQLQEEVSRLRPGLLLIDQSFGLRVLFEILETLRYAALPVRAVIWSKALTPVESRQLFDAGAWGVIEKIQPAGVLLDCFRAVAGGQIWAGPVEAGATLAERRVAMRITTRERQVLELLAEGLKNREIAQRLSITSGTVKVHLMHIFEKTGVRNRHELGLYAPHLLEARRKEPDKAAGAAGGSSVAEVQR